MTSWLNFLRKLYDTLLFVYLDGMWTTYEKIHLRPESIAFMLNLKCITHVN